VLVVARQSRAGADGYIVQRHPNQHSRRAGRRYAWPTTDDRQARRMVEALGLDARDLGL
jgi:hypothetical protein